MAADNKREDKGNVKGDVSLQRFPRWSSINHTTWKPIPELCVPESIQYLRFLKL